LDDIENKKFLNPEVLYAYVKNSVTSPLKKYYVIIDEVQLLPDFETVLNAFLRMENVDIYVSGSNARMLSKDVITEFRGRGDEIRIHPLSFKEFISVYDKSESRGLNEYMLYGGLPQILTRDSDEEKIAFLENLFTETYLRDINDRYPIKNEDDFEELITLLASNIGCLVNPTKIANVFKSVKKSSIDKQTIKKYIDYIGDAFILEKATRYDIKGNRYIDTPYKYYFEDMGLRNARLNFRQTEWTHLMENVIYNELRIRRYNVDVGVVPVRRVNSTGTLQRSQLEIDFVCNLGSKRYYIQSAYRMDSEEKEKQEITSLTNVDDSFKKIIIIGEDTPIYRNNKGVTVMGIYDFLLKDNSLDL
jgi:predicted AAA+ superfamily ATPase